MTTNTDGGLYIYSGNSNMGRAGDPVGANDYYGNPLHVGDIVQLWEGTYVDTEDEFWTPYNKLTAIVSDQFISYTDGTLSLKDGEIEFYCMGIASCGFDSPEWQIRIVKSHREVIEGERWKAYGFSYRRCKQADELLEERRKS